MNNSKYDSSLVGSSVLDTIESMKSSYDLIVSKMSKSRKRLLIVAMLTALVSLVSVVSFNYDLNPSLTKLDLPLTLTNQLESLKQSNSTESKTLKISSSGNFNSDFQPVVDTLLSFTESSLAKFISLTFIVGGICIGIMRQCIFSMASALAVGIMFNFMPTIIFNMLAIPSGQDNSKSLVQVYEAETIVNHLVSASDDSKVLEVWKYEGAHNTNNTLSLLEREGRWPILDKVVSLLPESPEQKYVSAQVNYLEGDLNQVSSDLNDIVSFEWEGASSSILYVLEMNALGEVISLPALEYSEELKENLKLLETFKSVLYPINSLFLMLFVFACFSYFLTRNNFSSVDKSWRSLNRRAGISIQD